MFELSVVLQANSDAGSSPGVTSDRREKTGRLGPFSNCSPGVVPVNSSSGHCRSKRIKRSGTGVARSEDLRPQCTRSGSVRACDALASRAPCRGMGTGSTSHERTMKTTDKTTSCWQWGGTCAFTFVPRRRGVARRAGPARRSRHRLEVGPALWPGNGTTFASATQTNQRQLVGG
jgi:hypothetical protein